MSLRTAAIQSSSKARAAGPALKDVAEPIGERCRRHPRPYLRNSVSKFRVLRPTRVRLGAFAAGRHAMEGTALAGSVLVIAGAIVWSMLNARERSRPE
jgi:hypothetical protein